MVQAVPAGRPQRRQRRGARLARPSRYDLRGRGHAAAPLAPRSDCSTAATPVVPVRFIDRAGVAGRVFASAFKIPFDVVKQRLEVQGAILAPREQRAYTYTGTARAVEPA